MKLSYQGLQDKAAWAKAGIKLPGFDWKAMCAETEKAPTWVHFGAGNIFRGFIAALQQKLLEQGLVKDIFQHPQCDTARNFIGVYNKFRSDYWQEEAE